ncbi:MAG: hypothetical protein KGI27_09975 [Thaumarchaeota archaeon]|nr:hypothetical protein [Nitrososphaerota archaeon]
MPDPSLFENALYGLLSKMPFGASQPTSIAQARITHTPIGFEPQPQGHPGLWGLTRPGQNWAQYALGHASGLAGIDPETQGNISIYQNQQGFTPKHVLKHEIIHAATIPDLQPGGKLYQQVQKLLPDDVVNTVKDQYQGMEHDPVHEGVSWLLTFPEFQDPKYNAAKLKVINAFPAATRSKITRILGAQ